MADARKRVHRVLEGEDQDPLARGVRAAITVLIVVNVAAVVAESVPEIAARWAGAFALLESAAVTIFAAEYLARVWSIVEDPRFAHPVTGRLRYAVSFMALVDLAAILPFFLPRLIPLDARFVRALRLLRVVRAVKLGRRSSGLALYARVIEAKRGELLLTLAVLSLLVLVAASAMYFIEHDAQPDRFSTIPASLWWAVVTLTTIGYGDVYPVTALGKVVGGMTAVVGVAFYAVPPAILVAGVMEEMQRLRAPATCPHCDKPIEPGP
jgi:voltage-gated potassium channel